MTGVAHVVIPAALRRLTQGAEQVEVEASNVRGLLRALDERFPGFSRELGNSFAVAIDGEVYQEPLFVAVEQGSEVHFLPAIAGGL